MASESATTNTHASARFYRSWFLHVCCAEEKKKAQKEPLSIFQRFALHYSFFSLSLSFTTLALNYAISTSCVSCVCVFGDKLTAPLPLSQREINAILDGSKRH